MNIYIPQLHIERFLALKNDVPENHDRIKEINTLVEEIKATQYKVIVGNKKYIMSSLYENPILRERITELTEGLWFGFKCEYHVAASLIIPQLEYLIREEHKAKNYTHDNLSSMLKRKNNRVEILSNDDIYHSINILLSNNKGCLNFRNDLMHGNLHIDKHPTPNLCYYTWYIALQMVFVRNVNKDSILNLF